MNQEMIHRLADEWRIAIGNTSYGGSSRSEDETVKYWDSQSVEYDLRMLQDYRRIDHVIDLLQQKGVLNRESKVLDLGCGTGNYTLELARRAKKVIAIDRSGGMGEVLCRKAKAWSIENIEFRQRNWNVLDVEQEGLAGWADVTMSGLNPSINSWEALEKISKTSREACCLVTFAGAPRNPVNDDLRRLLTGKEPKPVSNGLNVYYPFGLLYAAGYYPEVSYVPMQWVKEHAPEAAINRIVEENMLSVSDTPEVRRKVEKYVCDHLDADGMFREINETPLGVLFWRVNR